MSEETERLDWLAENVTLNKRNDHERWVAVTAPRGDAKLSFGAVPAGWTVRLQGLQGTYQLTAAEETAVDARWVLTASRRSEVHPSGGVRDLAVERGDVAFMLTASGITIRPGASHCSVDTAEGVPPVSYRLIVEGGQERTPLTVSGSARVGTLEGKGHLNLKAAFASDADATRFKGTLTATRAVLPERLEAPAAEVLLSKTAAGKGKRPKKRVVIVRRLHVHGDAEHLELHAAEGVTITGAARHCTLISDTQVHVMGEATHAAIRGEGTDPKALAILVGGRAANTRTGQVRRLKLVSQSVPSWTLQNPRPVRDCTITCEGPGAVVTGPLVDTRVSAPRSVVRAHGDLSWDKPGEGPFLCCLDLFVEKATKLGEAAQMRVGGDIAVRGGINGGAITADCVLRSQRDVNNASITAEQVQLEGPLTNSTVTADKMLVCGGPVDETSSVIANGSGEIAAEFDGELTWQAGADGRLVVKAQVQRLEIQAGEALPDTAEHKLPTLEATDAQVSFGQMTVSGVVLLEAVQNQHSRELAIAELAFPVDARRSALLLRSDVAVTVARVVGAHVEDRLLAFARPSERRGSGTLGLCLDDVKDLHMVADGPVRLSRTKGGSRGRPSLSISGAGPFEVSCQVSRMAATKTPPAAWKPVVGDLVAARVPRINVDKKGAVYELAGDVRLGRITGRISGVENKNRLGPWLHRTAMALLPASLRGRLAPIDLAPRVHAIAPQADRGAEGELVGHLLGVDPTPIGYQDLDNFKGLSVFEPAENAVLAYASKHVSDSFNRQDRAYRLQKLAKLVSDRAVSGGSRSAVMWATARSHHATISRGRGEWWLRTLHRCAGYSQRPLPALVLWLGVVLLGALVVTYTEPLVVLPPGEHAEEVAAEAAAAAAVQEQDTQPRPADARPGYWSQVRRLALLPAALLRLPGLESEPGHDPLPLYGNAAAHVVAFILVGLPLVYFVIALRNFLRSPIER